MRQKKSCLHFLYIKNRIDQTRTHQLSCLRCRILILRDVILIIDKEILDEIIWSCKPHTKEGKLASYIPELCKADADALGIAIAELGEDMYMSGDFSTRFTIQSVSKVFIFTCSLMQNDISDIQKKVSLEPTAEAFNSIVNLETKNSNKPLNAMINSGAIACLTTLKGMSSYEKYLSVLTLARRTSGNPHLDIDEDVYRSEKKSGARNRALAYYMLSTGIIEDDVEELLDAYFRICSIRMDCRDLARSALFFANGGTDPISGETIISRDIARYVKATLMMCGMYNESGRVAVKVGLPSKSGVGGGILSIVPGRMGIGIYGPALNEKGSSAAGIAALEMLSEKLNLSIF